MFFRNKTQDENFQRLETRLQALAEAVASGSSRLETLQQTVSRLETQSQTAASPDALNQTAASPDVLSQTDALSDALNQAAALPDALSQAKTQLEVLSQSAARLENSMSQSISRLQSDVHKHDMALEDLLDEWADKKSEEDSLQKQLKESAHAESVLLQLFESYQEQFWNLKHFAAAKDSSWSEQISLMEGTIEQCRRLCQISLIQDCGVRVSYELHDVIDAVETIDPALDKTVADIYRCGYFYKGTVKKKAQVSAYRLSK